LEGVLEHRLIQRQIGDDLLQASILLLELRDPPPLGHPHAGVALLPVVERRLAHAEPAAELGHAAGQRLSSFDRD
jgi:hypothetical protein